jgi:trimethylamine:corrinoid methyltransferase-like protein
LSDEWFLWRDQGARIENGCIKAPAGAAREIITRSAPPTFRQIARRDGFSLEFGNGAGVCAPASSTPLILDAGGHRRYTTKADLAVLARLVQESPGPAHAGSLCEVGDVPVPP